MKREKNVIVTFNKRNAYSIRQKTWWDTIRQDTFIANQVISRDASFHQTAHHALSCGRCNQVSKQNSTVVIVKRRTIFMLATRGGIDFRGVGMATSQFSVWQP